MAGKRRKEKRGRLRTALLLLEGETEYELYEQFAGKYAPRAPKHLKNLKGNWNINTKITDASVAFMTKNSDRIVDVFVCIDQERLQVPAYNHDLISGELRKHINFGSLIPVVTILMIESVLFLDVHGIYRHLRTPISKRKPARYKQWRSLTHRDLSELFRSSGKTYHKGHRCEGLVAALDFDKLLAAEELVNLKNRLVKYEEASLKKM